MRDLLTRLLAAVDRFTYLFVLQSVEVAVEGSVVVGPATLFAFSDEVISQIITAKEPGGLRPSLGSSSGRS